MPAKRRPPAEGQLMMMKRGGPGGPRAVTKGGAKLDPVTLKRLVGYIFKGYKLRFFIVFICIIINALSGVAASLFLKELINDYITPMVELRQQGGTPDLMPLVWEARLISFTRSLGMMMLLPTLCSFSCSGLLSTEPAVTFSRCLSRALTTNCFSDSSFSMIISITRP